MFIIVQVSLTRCIAVLDDPLYSMIRRWIQTKGFRVPAWNSMRTLQRLLQSFWGGSVILELVVEDVSFCTWIGWVDDLLLLLTFHVIYNGNTTATEESIGNGWEFFFSFSDTHEIPSGFIKCGWHSTSARMIGCDDSFFPIPTWNIFMRFVTILSHIKKLLRTFTSQYFCRFALGLCHYISKPNPILIFCSYSLCEKNNVC